MQWGRSWSARLTSICSSRPGQPRARRGRCRRSACRHQRRRGGDVARAVECRGSCRGRTPRLRSTPVSRMRWSPQASPTCGPTRRGAQLEASKAFAKEVMARAGIPTAEATAFTEYAKAADFLAGSEAPYVVKADGLAAGKGVLVTEDLIAAQGWARLCIDGHFGDAGTTVIIERYLDGEEVSSSPCATAGKPLPWLPSATTKRLFEDDKGPNTGGMGCYAPPAGLPDDLVAATMRRRNPAGARDARHGRHHLSGVPVRRAHADRRGSQGSRVQLQAPAIPRHRCCYPSSTRTSSS